MVLAVETMPASQLAELHVRLQQRRGELRALKDHKLRRTFRRADKRAQELFELGRATIRRGSVEDLARGL